MRFKEYNNFITGNNSDILAKFLEVAPDTVMFAGQFCRDQISTTPGADKDAVRNVVVEFVVVIYENLFKKKKSRQSQEAHDAFIDAANIISSYMTIIPKNKDLKE